jgi:hypothetical protein
MKPFTASTSRRQFVRAAHDTASSRCSRHHFAQITNSTEYVAQEHDKCLQSADCHSRQGRRALLALPVALISTAALQAAAAGSAPAKLSVDEVKKRLERCFEDDQYYVSGKLDRGIFAEDCVFRDPTVKLKGASAAHMLLTLPTAMAPSCYQAC